MGAQGQGGHSPEHRNARHFAAQPLASRGALLAVLVTEPLEEALEALGYSVAAIVSRAAEALYEEELLAGRVTQARRRIALGLEDQHRLIHAARMATDDVPTSLAPLEGGVAITRDDGGPAGGGAHWMGGTIPVDGSGFSDVIVSWWYDAGELRVRCVRTPDEVLARVSGWRETVLTALGAYRARCSRLGVPPTSWVDEVDARVARLTAHAWPRSTAGALGEQQGTLLARPAWRSSPVMIGRERELDAMGSVLATLPAVIAVSGEAGVGKSRFVAELVARTLPSPRSVFTGRCHALHDPFILGPIVEALREGFTPPRRWPRSTLAGALRPLLPELGESLPPLPELPRDPAAQRHVLFRAIAEVMRQAAPATWIFEDLHWADDMTLDFLRVLVQHPPPSAAVILTYRREDLAASSEVVTLHARVPSGVSVGAVELPCLTVEEVRRLVAAVVGAEEVSEGLAAYLCERTAGLPFAVEEVVHLLDDRKHLVRDSTGRLVSRQSDDLEVPQGIRDAVLQRTARLTLSARRVVDAAAILQVAAEPAQLSSVAGLDATETADALSQALEHAVIVDQGAAGFGLRHALACQAVQDAIPRTERQRLHRRAAEALATVTPLPAMRLAHHYQQAGAVGEWIRHAELAAEQSRGLGDDHAAVRLLTGPVGFADQDPRDRARLAVKLGIAALYARTRWGEVRTLLRRLVDESALPRDTRAELQYLAAVLRPGGVDRARVARCVGDLRHRPELAVAAMIMLAWPWRAHGTLSDHLRWARRAVFAADASGDPTLKLTAGAVQAQIMTACGDARAMAAIERIPWGDAARVDPRRLVMANVGLAWSLTAIGDAERGRFFLERAQQARRRVAYDPYLDQNIETLSIVRSFQLGEWEGLAARAARHVAATESSPEWWVSSRLVTAELALARQELDDAERWFEEGRLGAIEGGLTPAALDASAGLARVGLARGDPEAALQGAVAGVDLLARKGIWVWGASIMPSAVAAMLAWGRRDDAAALTIRFARQISGRRAPVARAALWECRGQLAEAASRWTPAAAALRSAQEGYRRASRPYLETRAAERLGTCELAGDNAAGAASLLRALERFEALHAAGDVARVRGALRRFGVNAPRPASQRRGRKSYGVELSPREQEVAQLAALGLSDEAIAARLYLSRRTVNHHVSSALTKLGLRSRRELSDDRERWRGGVPARTN